MTDSKSSQVLMVCSPHLMMGRMVMTMVIMCTVRTTLSNGCTTGRRARDRAGCSTTPGPSRTWRQVLGKECGLSLLIGCWLIVSHLGTDGWSPPVTLSRQRPGKPGRQQMA